MTQLTLQNCNASVKAQVDCFWRQSRFAQFTPELVQAVVGQLQFLQDHKKLGDENIVEEPRKARAAPFSGTAGYFDVSRILETWKFPAGIRQMMDEGHSRPVMTTATAFIS
jgi:hypothetical protein